MIRLSLIAICSAFSLTFANPASAQLSSDLPDTPIKEGQTLLEWAEPPILAWDIAPEKRGDLSTCDVTDESSLDTVARTCWPILQVAKLYIRMEFTAGEPSGDSIINKRSALIFGQQIIDLIGEPQWPLEKYYLMKTYEQISYIYRDFGQFAKALSASDYQIKFMTGTPGWDLEFRTAFAKFRRGEHLMALGRTGEAREALEDNYVLMYGRTGYKNSMPIAKQSEMMAVAALRSGDTVYAESIIDRYLQDAYSLERGFEFGLFEHVDLKLYILAGRGEIEEALALMDKRTAIKPSYSRCSSSDKYFPYVLAPLRKEPRIAEKLAALQCSDKIISKLNTTEENGIFGWDKKLLLPPWK